MSKKIKIADQLKAHFQDTSKEELQKEFDELQKFNNIGPTVEQFVSEQKKRRMERRIINIILAVAFILGIAVAVTSVPYWKIWAGMAVAIASAEGLYWYNREWIGV